MTAPATQRWWLSAVGIDPPRSPQRAARWSIVRLAHGVSPGLAVLLVTLVVIEGLGVLALQISFGAVIGSLAAGGPGLSRALTFMGVVYVVNNSLPEFRERLA